MDSFWYEDPDILINKNKFHIFFPTNKMNINEKLNSITRLSIYTTFILFMYSGNFNYFYIFILALIITYLVYKGKKNIKTVDEYINFKKKIIEPTVNNPFMNILLEDYNKNPKRIIKNKQKNNINKNFNTNLYRDIDDVFNRRNSQRQFYTTPVTTIPNDQTGFSNWLYQTKQTCKEGNGTQCVKNNYNPLYNFSSSGDFK